MSVKVKNGTPVNGPSLCETCTRAHFVKGYRESEVLVVCQAIYPERRVTFAVSECSSYVNKIRNTLIEMERIAWTLAPCGPKRKAGRKGVTPRPAQKYHKLKRERSSAEIASEGVVSYPPLGVKAANFRVAVAARCACGE